MRRADGHKELLQGRHINVIEIGTLFSIDLDVHEMLIHVAGDLGIREHLFLHDVAPVTTAVADRQENQLVFLARAFQGLRAPGIPIDGVVRVSEQVRARFAGKPIFLPARLPFFDRHGV